MLFFFTIFTSMNNNFKPLRVQFFWISRYWENVGPMCSAQQTQNICITFVQHRTNVADVVSMLYKCFVFAG